MRRPALALLLLAALALAVNTVVTDRETKAAEADVGRIVELPGGDLQLRERGPADGPAIVLLHCYTCSIHWWSRLEPLLTRSSRVVSVDLLGHGGSEKPREGYSAEDQADQVARALRTVGVRQALVVGQSLGGVIATALAERHPRLVRGVVAMDSPVRAKYRKLPLAARVARMPVIGHALRRVMPDAAIRDALGDAFAEGFEVPDQFVEDVRRMTFSAFERTPELVDGYISRSPIDDRLAATGLPLLVVFGAEDEVTDPAAADEFRDVPGARIVTLPGVGHTPQMERPRQTAALIREFQRSLRARP